MADTTQQETQGGDTVMSGVQSKVERQLHVPLPAPILRSASASPSRTVSNVTSPGPGSNAHQQQQHSNGLLSPSLPGSGTPTQSILLNKTPSPSESRNTSPPPGLQSIVSPMTTNNSGHFNVQQGATAVAPTPSAAQGGLAAPADSSSAAAHHQGYFSLDPNNAASANASSTGGTGGSTPRRDSSRSPGSPHCHFAPLPRVEGQDRPSTRRNSSAAQQQQSLGGALSGRSKPFSHHTSGSSLNGSNGSIGTHGNGELTLILPSDNLDEPFAIDLDDERLGKALRGLSLQRGNSSSLGGNSPALTGSPRQTRSRQGGASSRSASPSPSRQPQGIPHHPQRASSSNPGSRTHSPAMSRRASSDAMNLHYIEGSRAGLDGPGSARDRHRDRGEDSSRERSASNAAAVAATGASNVPTPDREREVEYERMRAKESAGWKEEREAAHQHHVAGRSLSPQFATLDGGSASVGGGPTSVNRTASPADSGTGAKRPMFVEPTAEAKARPPMGARKRSNEEVVEIEPGEESNRADEELEEVVEEDEDEDEDNEGDEDGDDDDEGDGEDRNDDEGGDDEESEPEVERATSRGAAVEVRGRRKTSVTYETD